MASTNYPQADSESSLVEVMKAAGLELRRLRARHRAVTKRIRHLRIAVGALRELKSFGARTGETARGETGNSTVAREGWRKIGAESRDLRRACRIALLETADAASHQEIFNRIVRRGSFLFNSAALAIPAIIEELNAMADEGEIRRIQADAEQLWQRSSPPPD